MQSEATLILAKPHWQFTIIAQPVCLVNCGRSSAICLPLGATVSQQWLGTESW